MATLRIAVDSSDALKAIQSAREALRALGAQASASEAAVVLSAEHITQALQDVRVPQLDTKQIEQSIQRISEQARGFAETQGGVLAPGPRGLILPQQQAPQLIQPPGLIRPDAGGQGIIQSAVAVQSAISGEIDKTQELQRALGELRSIVQSIGSSSDESFQKASAQAGQLEAALRAVDQAGRGVEQRRGPDLSSLQSAAQSANQLGTSLSQAGQEGATALTRSSSAASELAANAQAAVAQVEALKSEASSSPIGEGITESLASRVQAVKAAAAEAGSLSALVQQQLQRVQDSAKPTELVESVQTVASQEAGQLQSAADRVESVAQYLAQLRNARSGEAANQAVAAAASEQVAALRGEVEAAQTVSDEIKTQIELLHKEAAVTPPAIGTNFSERGFASAEAEAESYKRVGQGAILTVDGAITRHIGSIGRLTAAYAGLRGAADALKSLVAADAALADVTRTTHLAGDQLAALDASLVKIGTNGAPIAINELRAFAADAGRLQIKSPEGIRGFVEDIARLRTVAPDIGGSAGHAAEEVGRFLRLVGESPTNVAPLADSVARLSAEFAATPQQTLASAEGIARAGSQMVRSSADALGLAAAFSQLGLDGYLAGTTIAQVWGVVTDAVQRGGKSLRDIEQITGLSAEQIGRSFQTDKVSLFITVLEGLSRTGENSAQVLDDLGLSSARQSRTLGPLIQNTDLLRRAVESSREAQRKGTDAAEAAAIIQGTLGSRLQQTQNIVSASATANAGLAHGLADIVGIGNSVLASLLGISVGANGVTESYGAAAAAAQAFVYTAGGLFVLQKLASGWRLLTAELIVALPVQNLETGVIAEQTVALTGLAAAQARVAATSAAFLTTPLGFGLAIAGAVASVVAFSGALDSIDGDHAASELDKVSERLQVLDRSAQGLQQARDIIFRATLTDDTEGRVEGLRRRLQELEAASTAVSGEVRIKVAPIKDEFAQAIASAATANGNSLLPPEVQKRADEALALTVRGLTIPPIGDDAKREYQASLDAALTGVPSGVRERLSARVAEAVSGVTLPSEKVKALNVEELFPGLQDADTRLKEAIGRTLSGARDEISSERDKLQALLSESLRVNPGQFAGAAQGAALSALTGTENLASTVTSKLQKEVTDQFGPEFGARAVEAFNSAIAGKAADVDAKAFKVDLSKVFQGDLDTEKIDRFTESLRKAGASDIDANDFLAGIEEARRATSQQLDAVKFKKPDEKPSDFYKEEAIRIGSAISEIRVQIGTLPSAGTSFATPGDDGVLRGIEARRQALLLERAAYADSLKERVASEDVNQRITQEEANQLGVLADNLLAAKDASILFGEAQRRLGVEGQLLDRSVSFIDRQLQLLGARAGEDTPQQFELLRQQIELTRAAAEKNIVAAQLQGIPQDEIDRARAYADAEREIGLAALGNQKYLSDNHRAISELANASDSFGSNLFDALSGAQEPLEALKAFLLDITRDITQPFFKAAFIDFFGGKDKELKAQAARQAGVADLIPREPIDLPKAPTPELVQGPPVPLQLPSAPLPEASAAAKAAATLPDAVDQLAFSGGAAAAGLERVGVSSVAAATSSDHLAVAAEAAAQALQALAVGAKAQVPPVPAAPLPVPVQALQEAPAATPQLAASAAARTPATPTAPSRLPPTPSAPLTPAVPPAPVLLTPQRTPTAPPAITQLPATPAIASPALRAPPAPAAPAAPAPLAPAAAARPPAPTPLPQPQLPPVPARQATPTAPAPAPAAAARPPGPLLAQQALPASPAPLARQPVAVQPPAPPLAAQPVRTQLPAAFQPAPPTQSLLQSAEARAANATERLAQSASTAAPQVTQFGGTVAKVVKTTQNVVGVGESQALSPDLEGIGTARAAFTRQAVGTATSNAATAAGGAAPFTESLDVKLAPLLTASEQATSSFTTLAVSQQAATASVSGLGAASTVAGTGLTQTGVQSLVAATGMTAVQAAAFTAAASFLAATQAAAVFASQVGTKAALAALTGGPPLAHGAVVGGGVIAYADGGIGGKLPTVSDLSGSVVGKPTFALIGEGADREGIFPLDRRGGVRAVGPSGERSSLPITRDAEGKLAVRVNEGDVQRFAFGGVTDDRFSDSLPQDRSAAFSSSSLSNVDARSISTTTDRSMSFVSHYHFHGSTTPDAGFRRSARQHEQDLRDRTRNVLKGRVR